jgi:chromosomal replication initiation ATPase DnaA
MRHDHRQFALALAPQTGLPAPPFIAAASNQSALAWLDRKEVWPERRLLLAGDSGSGKTHLLHDWAAANRAVMVAGAELPFPVHTASGHLAIDDADRAPEEALLHVLNAAGEAGWFVLLSAQQPPARWDTSLPDLASRLRGIFVAQIGPAEEHLLRLLLDKLLSERQLAMAKSVRAWMMRHLPRNQAAVRDAVARLDRGCGDGRINRAHAAAVVDEVGKLWQAKPP